MKKSDILNLSGIPPFSPSYSKGPYRFIGREYFIIAYETDEELVRAALPEPLEYSGNNVSYEFLNMKDSSGNFGSYAESGIVIPCRFMGENVNFTAQMYLNDEPPTTGGREIWGFPKKIAEPKLEVVHDTLTGTLDYAGQRVAMGTMRYKEKDLIYDLDKEQAIDDEPVKKILGKTQVNLKLIPDETGNPAIVQLIAYNMTDITVRGAWQGGARLHLVPHVNAPVADFPVRKITGGFHYIADITLPYGRVIHDYLKS